MNVFVVASPLQLINAIEAKHSLNLRCNQIIVILGVGYANDLLVYDKLLSTEDWDSVRYIRVKNEKAAIQSQYLSKFALNAARKYIGIYRRYSNRRVLDNIAKSFGLVDNAILGNYLEDGELYMRHFANSIKYQHLYLLDDGTDVIRVNNDRKSKMSRSSKNKEHRKHVSLYERVKKNLYERYVGWNDREAARVIFFTAYDLEVKDTDAVVKNPYTHLRNILCSSGCSNQVLFLGQSLIEDGWVHRDVYLRYLGKVRTYFAGRNVSYVPHPRESRETVSYVRDILGFTIRRPFLPIEIDLAIGGADMPDTLASFFCSALVNCSVIFDKKMSIKAFHIGNTDVMLLPEFVDDVYKYFDSVSNEYFELISL